MMNGKTMRSPARSRSELVTGDRLRIKSDVPPQYVAIYGRDVHVVAEKHAHHLILRSGSKRVAVSRVDVRRYFERCPRLKFVAKIA